MKIVRIANCDSSCDIDGCLEDAFDYTLVADSGRFARGHSEGYVSACPKHVSDEIERVFGTVGLYTPKASQ